LAEKAEIEKEEKKKVEEEEEEVEEIVEERFYTVPLRKAWIASRFERTEKAVRLLKKFLRRHLKTEDFKISRQLNELIWSRGIKNPPPKVRIRVVKDKEGIYTVYPLKKKA